MLSRPPHRAPLWVDAPRPPSPGAPAPLCGRAAQARCEALLPRACAACNPCLLAATPAAAPLCTMRSAGHDSNHGRCRRLHTLRWQSLAFQAGQLLFRPASRPACGSHTPALQKLGAQAWIMTTRGPCTGAGAGAWAWGDEPSKARQRQYTRGLNLNTRRREAHMHVAPAVKSERRGAMHALLGCF